MCVCVCMCVGVCVCVCVYVCVCVCMRVNGLLTCSGMQSLGRRWNSVGEMENGPSCSTAPG